MDAQLLRTSLLLAVAWILGAGDARGAHYGAAPAYRPAAAPAATVQSQSFSVTAPTPEFARKMCEAAEYYRHALAVDWLGAPLPPWQDVCPIHVTVGPHLGAGGATSFVFVNGQPRQWKMEIQGSPERLLDSVLPHEITHMIFASHFGCPLPRWADEGAATSVEHISERTKQDQLLIQFLTTNRGIAFNQMFAMREYPRDILPLYSQGYSLARYLIAQGGRRKFVEYVRDGLQWNNWTAATHRHYGLRSLSELQISWLDWVRQGSPEIRVPAPEQAPHATAVAGSLTPPSTAVPATLAIVTPDAQGESGLVPLPAGPAARAHGVPLADTHPVAHDQVYVSSSQDSWYTLQRDLATSRPAGVTTDLRPVK